MSDGIARKMGMTILVGLLAVWGMMLPGCAPAGNDNTNDNVEPGDQTVLEQAAERAQELDSDAVVFSMSGMVGTEADETYGLATASWEFLAINPDASDTYYRLMYDGETWTDETVGTPLVGVVFVDLLTVTMTEADARAILEAADAGDDFTEWSLYQPLSPDFPNPLYTFAYAEESISIDVEAESVTWSPYEEPLGDGGGIPGEDSISQIVIAAAGAQIADVDPDAVIVWAGGSDGDGNALSQPSDTNVWDFVAVAVTATGTQAWSLRYDGSGWDIDEQGFPPFGVLYVSLGGIPMDVVEAWQLAVDAGYDPPFDSWTAFQPLHPNAENAVYVFPTNAGFVLVDVVTGEVTLE